MSQEKTRKFFDENWKEVPAEQAKYVIELVHDEQGRVVSSTTYVRQERTNA